MPILQKMKTYKAFLREAGRITRDELSTLKATDPTVLDMTLSTISRALWNNDVKIATLLLNRSELAAK